MTFPLKPMSIVSLSLTWKHDRLLCMSASNKYMGFAIITIHYQ